MNLPFEYLRILLIFFILINPANYGLASDEQCEDFSILMEVWSTFIISSGESLDMSIDLLTANAEIINRFQEYYQRGMVGAYQHDMLNNSDYLKRLEYCLQDAPIDQVQFVNIMSSSDFLVDVLPHINEGDS